MHHILCTEPFPFAPADKVRAVGAGCGISVALRYLRLLIHHIPTHHLSQRGASRMAQVGIPWSFRTGKLVLYLVGNVRYAQE